MNDDKDKQKPQEEKPKPETPSQAEGDERTVDQALKNNQSNEQK